MGTSSVCNRIFFIFINNFFNKVFMDYLPIFLHCERKWKKNQKLELFLLVEGTLEMTYGWVFWGVRVSQKYLGKFSCIWSYYKPRDLTIRKSFNRFPRFISQPVANKNFAQSDSREVCVPPSSPYNQLIPRQFPPAKTLKTTPLSMIYCNSKKVISHYPLLVSSSSLCFFAFKYRRGCEMK